MAIADHHIITVLVGPTCPTCDSDDLRWGAPLGALWHGQCRDCGTEYRSYRVPEPDDIEARPEPACDSCGSPHVDAGEPLCEDCALSDCLYCGAPTNRCNLSANLACRMCEEGEAA